MKHCIKCGADLQDYEDICSRCGAKNPGKMSSAHTDSKGSGHTRNIHSSAKVVAIVIMVAIGVIFLFLCSPKHPERDKEESAIHHNKPVETQESILQETHPPENEDVPLENNEGLILIDESWENGNLQVVARDDDTLWIQLTDSRSDQEYLEMGTPWRVNIVFGEPVQTTKVVDYPYHIALNSFASRELLASANEQVSKQRRITDTYLCSELHFEKRVFLPDSWEISDEVDVDSVLDKVGNTYSATITFPEWFGVSAVNDFQKVHVFLDDIYLWSSFLENGQGTISRHLCFEP